MVHVIKGQEEAGNFCSQLYLSYIWLGGRKVEENVLCDKRYGGGDGGGVAGIGRRKKEA